MAVDIETKKQGDRRVPPPPKRFRNSTTNVQDTAENIQLDESTLDSNTASLTPKQIKLSVIPAGSLPPPPLPYTPPPLLPPCPPPPPPPPPLPPPCPPPPPPPPPCCNPNTVVVNNTIIKSGDSSVDVKHSYDHGKLVYMLSVNPDWVKVNIDGIYPITVIEDESTSKRFYHVKIHDYIGASENNIGRPGAVPAPSISDRFKFLSGDGSWEDIPSITAEEIDRLFR